MAGTDTCSHRTPCAALVHGWLPKLALSRAQALAELRRLKQQVAEPPGSVRVQSWNHAAQRWESAGVLLPSPWARARAP